MCDSSALSWSRQVQCHTSGISPLFILRWSSMMNTTSFSRVICEIFLLSSLYNCFRHVPDFDTLDLKTKIMFLKSHNAIKKTGEFVFRAMEARRSILYKNIKHGTLMICPHCVMLHVFLCIFMHIDTWKSIAVHAFICYLYVMTYQRLAIWSLSKW